jgi:pyruvate kinase
MSIRALTLDVRVGESVSMDGGRVTLTVEEKSGQRARLRFLADDAVTIRKQGAAMKPGAEQARAGIKT